MHMSKENRCLEGLAIDDTTFQKCAHGVPRVWPNTQDWVSNCQSSGASLFLNPNDVLYLKDPSNFIKLLSFLLIFPYELSMIPIVFSR